MSLLYGARRFVRRLKELGIAPLYNEFADVLGQDRARSRRDQDRGLGTELGGRNGAGLRVDRQEAVETEQLLKQRG